MKITEKQLIDSLKQMREIKPRKEWVFSLKSQILSEQNTAPVTAKSPSILDIFSSVFLQKKLAYSFAVILFLIVGVFGFATYTVPGDLLFPVKKIAEQSQASLTGQTGLKENVATLNSRINDLAQVAKEGRTGSISSAIDEVKINASVLAKNLKANPVQDSTTIKELTNSVKTLADIPGTDLSSNPDFVYIYQTIVQSQIADLEKTTLTDDQNNTLAEAKDLYDQGKYGDAFEKIWDLSNRVNKLP